MRMAHSRMMTWTLGFWRGCTEHFAYYSASHLPALFLSEPRMMCCICHMYYYHAHAAEWAIARDTYNHVVMHRVSLYPPPSNRIITKPRASL
jgi:hypothetical protein